MINLSKDPAQQKSFNSINQSSPNVLPNKNQINNPKPQLGALLSNIKPKKVQKPLEGQRIVKFIGFVTGRSRFGRDIVSLLFKDADTGQQIGRTVNIDPELSERSYFTKFTAKLINDPVKFNQAVAEGGNAFEALINEQREKEYIALCRPSPNGKYTDIIDFHRFKED